MSTCGAAGKSSPAKAVGAPAIADSDPDTVPESGRKPDPDDSFENSPAGLPDTLRARMVEKPFSFDVLSLMRRLDAAHPGLPALGRSVTLSQEIAIPRQDPFLEFPSSNVTRVSFHEGAATDVHIQFMGYFGPQGALPLTLSAEAYQWLTRHNDPSFARFADIFSARFVQMFYRAWADARPVVQMDRPEDDRFGIWLGSLIGLGSPATQKRDSLPDEVRLGLAGLLSSRVRSVARLQQCLRHILGTPVTLEEHVGTWLEFDPADCSRLGQRASNLGENMCLGTRAFSLNDKLRLVLHCRDLDEYHSFLPGQPQCRWLVDFLRAYLGPLLEVDIALSLPEPALPPTRLGAAGQLGWTSFSLSPPDPDSKETQKAAPTGHRICAVFSAAAPHPPPCPAPSDRPRRTYTPEGV